MRPGTVQACRAAPTPATTESRLGSITQQVQQLQIGHDGSAVALLFRDTPAPLLSDAPAPRRPSAPLKSRATSTLSRRSARQAANPSTPLVWQRASLRLVQEFGILGPKEHMTVAAVEALLHRFDKPLTEDDITCIAKLTRLNIDVLRTMAGLVGPEGDAQE